MLTARDLHYLAPMSITSPAKDALRSAVRLSGRVRERVQLQNVHVTGRAPMAVVEALKASSIGRPSAAEKAWIDRIELLRELMLRSPQPLEIVDFGAGAGSEFDNGEFDTKHTTTRTLGAMSKASKPPHGAYRLFRFVRALKPASALEMGACVGVSAAYQAAALELNGSGRLITLEGADVLATRSARTLEELGLDQRAKVIEGRFTDTLDGALAELKPIGMAFIDGHHIESATVDYMNAILPFAADEALLIFDDINWSEGMRKAWTTIADDPRFALTVDLGATGLAVLSASATDRHQLKLAYY